MPKKHTTLYLDVGLIDQAKKHHLNMSYILSKALTDEIKRAEGIDPRQEEIKALSLKLEQLRQEITTQENKAGTQENKPTEPTKEIRPIDPVLEKKLKIKREIKAFSSYIRRGLLSTSTKRDQFFRQRSRDLGLDYAEYLTLIVDPANKLRLSGKEEQEE